MQVCTLQKDFTNIVQGQKLRKDQKTKRRFLIRNVYAHSVSQWNHDKSIHPRDMDSMDMADAKLHRPKPSIPLTATSKARDGSGALETVKIRGRKKGNRNLS